MDQSWSSTISQSAFVCSYFLIELYNSLSWKKRPYRLLWWQWKIYSYWQLYMGRHYNSFHCRIRRNVSLNRSRKSSISFCCNYRSFDHRPPNWHNLRLHLSWSRSGEAHQFSGRKYLNEEILGGRNEKFKGILKNLCQEIPPY